MSSKSPFDECSFLITCHCSCLPYIKIWLVGFVRYLNHTRHVMNGQGLQLSCWIIPKSGNCSDYKNKTCNCRHLNTEIHEGNPWLISTRLWVSSNSFAVTSAKCVQVGKVTKVTFCLKTWSIKLLKWCYASDLLLATALPITTYMKYSYYLWHSFPVTDVLAQKGPVSIFPYIVYLHLLDYNLQLDGRIITSSTVKTWV